MKMETMYMVKLKFNIAMAPKRKKCCTETLFFNSCILNYNLILTVDSVVLATKSLRLANVYKYFPSQISVT